MELNVEWLLSQFSRMVLPSFVPFAIAAVVAFWPGKRPNSKWVFVVISVALTFGLPMVLVLLFSPIEFYLIYLEPAFNDQGLKTIPSFVLIAIRAIQDSYLGLIAVLSVSVSIFLRRRVWDGLFPTVVEPEHKR